MPTNMFALLLIFLILASGAAFLAGVFFFVVANGAIHEIEGLVLFLISAVCFVGFVVAAAVGDLKDYFAQKGSETMTSVSLAQT